MTVLTNSGKHLAADSWAQAVLSSRRRPLVTLGTAPDARTRWAAAFSLADHKGSNLWRNAMTNDTGDLDKIDEAFVSYDLSDEVLEAAARVDGGLAITVGYCATASNDWYCLPY
jgi:hypothetical protein